MRKLTLWGGSLVAFAGLAWGSFSYYQSDIAEQQLANIKLGAVQEAKAIRQPAQSRLAKSRTPEQIAEDTYEAKRTRRLKGWSKPKSDGPDKYAEMQERIRTREGEQFPGYGMNQRMEELKKARQRLAGLRTESFAWDSRGPANVPGRARAVLPLPSDSQNNWLIGSAAGGVWKTTDAGDTWSHTTDQLPNLATTTLAMSQGVIYAGTGELVGGSIGVNGMGIFRSTDEGDTWEALPSTKNDLRFTNVNRIIVNPDDPSHIVAATSAYNRNRAQFSDQQQTWIVYSKDGGETWQTALNGPGAITQVIASANNFDIQYAGYTGDGVWKSTDGGQTWQRSSTGMNSILGRIELGVSEVMPDRIFAAAQGNRTSDGSDMYYSDNAGQTWNLMTEENDGTNQDFLGGQGWYDNTVIAHPYNPDIVYVGGVNTWKMEIRSGVTSTTDLQVDQEGTSSFLGFARFSNVRFFNGAINTPEGLDDADLLPIEIRFGEGVGQKAHRFTVGGQGPGVPVGDYQYEDYIDVPFEVWDTQNNRQLMVSFRDQAGNGVFDLVEESFSEDDPSTDSREYLFIHDLAYDASAPAASVAQNGGHVTSQQYSVFPLLASGGTWDPDNLPDSKLAFQPVTVSVRDRITSNMTDAYQQFGGLNPFFNKKEQTNDGIHPDQHYLWVLKGNESAETFRLLVTNDGGIYKTILDDTPGEQQGEWNYAGGNMVTGQFHGVDKRPGANAYFGGLQDNGTWRSEPGEESSAASLYDPMFGGDGFDVVWNQRDPNLMIGGSQFNGFARSEDGGESWAGVTGVASGQGVSSFFSPLGNARTNPDIVFTLDNTGIWRSPDFGLSWEKVEVDDADAWAWNMGIPQVKVSEAYNQVVWAGSGIGSAARMMVSQDGGRTFEATSGYDGETLGGVSGFATHTTEPYTAYALFSFPNAPKVVRTQDLGETWEDISGFEGNTESDRGFPDVAVYDLLVMPHNPDMIWVGSEIGMIESTDGGASWHLLDSDLPAAPVFDMKISDDQVVIGTHGRGIWSATIEDIPQLTFNIPPVITSVSNEGPSALKANVELESAYDSTQVFVNDVKVGTLEPEGSFSVDITDLSAGDYNIQVKGFTEGLPYASNVYEAAIIDPSDILDSYATDFEDSEAIFGGENMEIRENAGFEGQAIHSPHPYVNGEDHTMTMDLPIRIAENDAFVVYDEVAIIEPGEAGTSFGDPQFWDYAVVEASFNKSEWFPVADGYDASDDSGWTNAYNSEADGTDELIRTRKINLSNELEAGDVVFLRFRLFADQEVNAWGWMIDNLHIQENRAPIAEEQTLTVGIEETSTGDFNDMVTDPDGDGLVINTAPVTAPSTGSLTINEDGTFSYTAPVEPGEDFFEVEVCDDRVNSLCTTLRVNVEHSAALGYDEEVANRRLAIQAYPNPAANSATAQYFLPESGEAVIQVMGLDGRQLFEKQVSRARGQHELPIQLDDYAKGMYLLRIESQGNTYISKFLVK